MFIKLLQQNFIHLRISSGTLSHSKFVVHYSFTVMKKIFLLMALVFWCAAILYAMSDRIKGSGSLTTESRSVENFNGAHVMGSGQVYITQGSTQSVKVEADNNIIEHVKTEVRGGTLHIGMEDGSYSNYTLKVYLTMPDVRRLEVSGSGDISALSALNVKELSSIIRGSGNISIKGKADEHKVEIYGSGDVEAADFEAEQASIKIAGSGDCKIYAVKNLSVKISGSGDVRYKGNPLVSQTIRGSGDVKKW